MASEKLAFFMDLKIIPTEEAPREDISISSLRDKPKQKQPEIKAEQVELSKNIQKFDKKPRVYTQDPYSYNAVSLKPRVVTNPTATAEQMITSPLYNTIGKFLGIDTVHDWNRYYDKVFVITEWARRNAKDSDTNKLIKWIGNKAKTLPSVGDKRIDNLYLFARLAKK